MVGRLTSGLAVAAYRGHNVICPCCGGSFRRFHDFNGANRQCWTCRSLERHRIAALYLRARPELLQPGMRVLHIAPERSLVPLIRAVGDGYTSGGLEETGLDVSDLSRFDDASFDATVCNHVLEEVPDDRRAMLELRRVLKPGGWGMLLVPGLADSETEEDLTLPRGHPRVARFGNPDSVRRYGLDYFDRLAAAGFAVEVEDVAKLFRAEVIYRARLRKYGELEPLVLVR